MSGIISVIVGLIVLIGFGVWEFFSTRYYRRKIPCIIHVNGTRGKSSVTRLIAAGLRAGGHQVLAKTTGSAPRLIFKNDKEVPVVRYFGANIKEQLKVIKFAAKRKIDYLVLECMAVTPEYQWVCEHKMVKSDIGVMTNCRLDHLDVMGPGIRNCTLSLCNTLPEGKVMVTSEYRLFPLMQKAGKKKGTKLIYAEKSTVSDEEMRGFYYIEHKDNVALALKVCDLCNVDREAALQSMYTATPDIGALEVFKFKERDKEIYFAHSFAANDPESTKALIDYVMSVYSHIKSVVLILNTRADRMYRSVQLAEMAGTMEFDKLILAGEEPSAVKSHSLKFGVKDHLIEAIGHTGGDKLVDIACSLEADKVILFGIGNIGGNGQIIVDYFRERNGK